MRGSCQNCRKAKTIHQHHVIPQVLGGLLVVYLCEDCHSKVHDKDMRISRLTKIGLQKAKKNGARLGRKPTDNAKIEQAKKLRKSGLSFSEIGKEMGFTRIRAYQLVKMKINKDDSCYKTTEGNK